MALRDNLGPGVGGLGDHAMNYTPEELFQRYYRPVVAFFMRRGCEREQSRDLAQETFLRVHKNMGDFRGESSVETWLFQIAGNIFKNTLRSQSTLKRDAEEVPLETPEGELVVGPWASEEEGALGAMLTGERARLLREALQSLPPQMRQAVHLRVDGDLKYREIADLMGVSIETVKAHLYQARQQLRDKLADYFTDDVT